MEEILTKGKHDIENQLLIECSQSLKDPGKLIHISKHLDQSLNWSYVLAVANKNAVLPLVGNNLLEHFADRLPGNVRGILIEYLRVHVQRNLFLTGKLLEIVRSFDRQNISILPFKGPVLAVRAYGSISARSFVDLDILVQPEHLEAAIELLRDEGYTPITGVRATLHRKKDIYFRSADGLVNVELHWKLSGSHFALPFEMNGLWARLENIDLANVKLKALPFDDLLIYLCLHGSRHGWERFGWICDVNELTMSVGEVDWDEIIRKARQLGCENVLCLGLYLVHDFFGRQFKFRGWHKVRSDLMFMTTAKRIREQLFTEQHTVMGIGDRYAYHLRLKEDRLDKWKLHYHYLFRYLRIIFTPKAGDTEAFNFPRSLEPLYYLLRPFRLFYNYALKSNRNRI